MSIRRFVVVALAACILQPLSAFAQANQQQAQLRVTVVDQTGAGIPAAEIHVAQPSGTVMDVTGDGRGQATVANLPVGTVQVVVESPGFATFTGPVTLRRGANNQTVTLYVAGLEEEVIVSDSTADAGAGGNALTTTLEEEEVAELSDDPDELRAQLEAMTGGAGAIFQVNGFRGGRLPNRDEIRRIRFRTNSFAADNHDAGRTLVEIITKPGLSAWDGNANLGFRNDVLNAKNAFARAETPEQFRRFSAGLRGPLVKGRTSLRLGVDGNRSFDSAIIVAQLPGQSIGDQVKRPFQQTNFDIGVEHGLSANQILRFEYRRSEDTRTNLGVGDFSLRERAFSRFTTEHQVRTSLQSIVGRTAVNEFRVQWNREANTSESISQAPTVIVIDAFSSGGAGVSSDGMTRALEVADNFDFTVGRHAMRVGVLLEANTYQNSDSRNAAGTFTFGSLEAFLAGTPNTYTQRLGQLRTAFSHYQVGVYWQDEFRLNRRLSLGVGVRQEIQSHVGDVMNFMPRLGFTYTPQRVRATIRGGYGIYHDWYEASLHDQTLRVTGEAGGQRDLLVLNPGYPNPTGAATATVLGGGRVQADPDLRMPYVHQASIGLERQLAPNFNVQTSYQMLRGRSQLRSINVNAPDANGVRPEPTVGTVTQIESAGKSENHRVTVGTVYRVPQQRMFLSMNYTWARVRNFADGALSLPADSRNPDAEWGPASQDIRHRLNAMVNLPLPMGIRANLGGNWQSAAPYNITTGRDDNADGVSNDRPAGVGRNAARGASRFDTNMRLTRAFAFGTRSSGQAAGGQGGGGQRGGGPGGGGPGGPGGGGGTGDGTERFRLEFYVQAFNLLNRTNYVNFSGNLQSPFFGQPTSAAQARRVEVGMQVRF